MSKYSAQVTMNLPDDTEVEVPVEKVDSLPDWLNLPPNFDAWTSMVITLVNSTPAKAVVLDTTARDVELPKDEELGSKGLPNEQRTMEMTALLQTIIKRNYEKGGLGREALNALAIVVVQTIASAGVENLTKAEGFFRQMLDYGCNELRNKIN